MLHVNVCVYWVTQPSQPCSSNLLEWEVRRHGLRVCIMLCVGDRCCDALVDARKEWSWISGAVNQRAVLC